MGGLTTEALRNSTGLDRKGWRAGRVISLFWAVCLGVCLVVTGAAVFLIIFLTAGHFMGNNTVLDVLRREGYEVEHAPAGRPINK